MGDSTGPRPNDGVWHHEYKNGVILKIDWEERDVYVFFYPRYGVSIFPIQEVFDLDLFDCFEDRFNQWMLYGYGG